MKFDPWTFAFQIINFGVLLLILKRVLYKPVREIMEKRRALAVKTLEEAQQARDAAQELQEKNQAELQRIEAQRGQLLEEMRAEVARLRQKMLAEAEQEAQRHIDKVGALQEAEQRRREVEIKDQAVGTVEVYAASLLAGVADAELHRALYRRLLDEVAAISAGLQDVTSSGGDLEIEVISAYPLEEDDEQRLRQAFAKATGCAVTVKPTVEHELLAGVKLMIGDWGYDASLRGQVRTFMAKIRRDA